MISARKMLKIILLLGTCDSGWAIQEKKSARIWTPAQA